MVLEKINNPNDIKNLSSDELTLLAQELRELIIKTVSRVGGHLGSNLGSIEFTLAIHRVFDSPHDPILWDTGHQSYAHKLITGRRDNFSTLRQAGGISGYPNRKESEHDWVENSHASTILSYAHGLANAFELKGETSRRIVSIIGDGALTGGMAYEALNNLGHSGKRVVIVLNDNGRSYAPTVSRLSQGLSKLRLNPSYLQARSTAQKALQEIPGGGALYPVLQALKAAFREVIEPQRFFETLGVRYTGPFDGHDIEALEQALSNAAKWEGPIVVHVLTQKGKGYAPAEEDLIQCLHDVKVNLNKDGSPNLVPPSTYTDAFTQAIIKAAEKDPDLVALTAAMPGPTGLLPFQSSYPERMFDVGIAEQHAVTAAAGMAMGGLHPVVAIYSTFFSRAFDQANLDVGLHNLPVVFALDRAGITGDDGPSHHGILDMALGLKIPGLTIFAPSSANEVTAMFNHSLTLKGPSLIRYPKGTAPQLDPKEVGSGLQARKLKTGSDVCILAIGKMVQVAKQAAKLLEEEKVSTSLWDVRVVQPPDPNMLKDASEHMLVVTIEDGIKTGGAGSFLVEQMAQLHEDRRNPPTLILGIPTTFIPTGKVDDILSKLGLDAQGVSSSIFKALHANSSSGFISPDL